MDGSLGRRNDDAWTRDDADLDAAISSLARSRPHASAVRRVTPAQWAAAAALCLIGAVFARLDPMRAIACAMSAGAGLFYALVCMRLAAAHRALEGLEESTEPITAQAAEQTDAGLTAPVYTLLCPLYREADAVPGLLAAIEALDHPHDRLDVKFVVEADDCETLAALAETRLPAWAEIVRVPNGGPRTKPKALNFAMARARGDFVCVYDAEDEPDPLQLRVALDAFARHGPMLGCVQAPLVVANAEESWIARQFAAEYAIQFGQTLPFFASIGAPFAIGGTSNHFRRAALESCGGWDPYNVTEDADIGFRLARCGWAMTTIDAPTYEEAPTTIQAWIRQRSRWIKGHLQTWLVLMRDPVRLWRELGPKGFCAMQMQLGGGLAAAFAHGPLALLLAWRIASGELGIAGVGLVISGYASAACAAIVAAFRLNTQSHLRAAASMPFYWPLASLAAGRALIELVAAPFYWAKTDHRARSRCRFGPRP